MGGGDGGGRMDEGVRGGWLVTTFLLLLTGWQVVLLPWAPLILRSAGFTPTGVGVVACLCCVSGSVGVMVCLGWVRRTRSGGVRRLLMLVSLAAAILFQVSSVVLLQVAGSAGGGDNPACAAYTLVHSTPPPHTHAHHQSDTNSTLSPAPHNTTGNVSSFSSSLSPPLLLRNTTTATSVQTNITTKAHVPSTTTSTFTTTTSTAAAATAITITTSTTTTTTTATTTATTTTPPLTTTTTTASMKATPSLISTVQGLTTSTDTMPTYGSVVTAPPGHSTATLDGQQVSSGKTEHSSGKKPGPHKGKGAGDTSQREPGTEEGRYQRGPSLPVHPSHRHPPAQPHPHTQHEGRQTPNDAEWNRTSGNKDDSETQSINGEEPEEFGEEYSEYDESDEGDKSYGEGDVRNLMGVVPRHGSLSSVESHLPSVDSSSEVSREKLDRWDGGTWSNKVPAGPLRPHTPKVIQRMGPPPVFSDEGSQSVRRDPGQETYPNLLSLLPHQDASPPHHGGTNWWELPSGSLTRHHIPASQSPHHYKRPGFHHATDRHHERRPGETRRGRRSIGQVSLMGLEGKADDSISDNDNKKTQRNPSLQQTSRSLLEAHGSAGVAVGVALLLVVGGMAGSGVECGVAQLWHCYTHGYDEGGMSQDVLQRTVTHTFHLSVYASHKAWSGLTSGVWVLGAGVVSILSCLVGVKVGDYACLAGLHLTLGTLALLTLLVLPVPYGSIDPPRTRRPLSLYLDDEVLREGVRRLTFHTWVWSCGALAALSLTFSLWLVQELEPQGWVVGGQAGAVGVTVAVESLTLQLHHRLITRWGIYGVMGVATVALTLHYILMWTVASVGVVVMAHAGLGVAMALLWVAVKHNSLLLATVSDQEREAWASWWCWRVGVGVGAILWGVGVTGSGGRVAPLLLLATLLSGILASAVGVAAILNRRSSRTRRRIYHTLDLGMDDDGNEDDDDEEAAEDDWLVRRARKEGMKL